MSLKFAAAGLSFLITFIIARVYGAEVSGQYALFSVTVLTFGLIAVFGNDHLLVRRMAGYAAVGRLGFARLSYVNALRWSLKNALVFAAALGVLAVTVGDRIGATWTVAAAAAAGFVLQALFIIANAAVRSTNRLVQSQLLQIVQPAVVILTLLATIALVEYRPGEVLMIAFLAGLAIAASVSLLYVRRLIGDWPLADQAPPEEGGANSTKLGLTVALDMATMWAALTLTGAIMSVADAGVFRVCLQFITVVAIIGTTLEGLMGPRYAGHAAKGNLSAARRTLNRSIAFLIVAGGVPLSLIAVFAEPLLGLMGEEFRAGAGALRILALGQLMAMAAGTAGTALNMNGREDLSLGLAVASFVIVIPTIAILGSRMGLLGAASGLAIMWAIRYQGSHLFARRILGRSD